MAGTIWQHQSKEVGTTVEQLNKRKQLTAHGSRNEVKFKMTIELTKSPNLRMTKGQLAMLGMKASIEGVGMSECVTRSVEAYKPTSRIRICVECKQNMFQGTANWEFPLQLVELKHTLVITNVPIMQCECGLVSHNLDVEISVDELVDQLVLDALRYQKEVPKRISIEELFKEKYLGRK